MRYPSAASPNRGNRAYTRPVGFLRERATYANVMSTLAVFIALGGSSYAAIQLGANSVRSVNIKNGAVKKRDLGRNSVNSSKVVNGSLMTQDFAPGQLPRGEPGPQGERGPQGEQGPTGSVDTSNFYDTAASDSRYMQAANGRSFMTAVAPGADFQVQAGDAGKWRMIFSCADPTSAPSTLQFANSSDSAVNLFTDDGSANPTHTLMPAHSITGGVPTNPGGDAIDFDAQGFPDGSIVHVHVLTLNRTVDCHFQFWVTEMTAGGGILP
jgi:hypothetical protein